MKSRCPVWFDAEGPLAAIGLTAWRDRWQADIYRHPSIDPADLWPALMEAIDAVAADKFEMLVPSDDPDLERLAVGSGFHDTAERSGTSWMSSADRPAVSPVGDGCVIVDRLTSSESPHPMRVRNGEEVESRLQQCSLYDPALDLAVVASDGSTAGYALFWYDALTGVGMLEPMRVEDAFQRRGLARALLTEGLERLGDLGASRFKVGFDGEGGRNLYVSTGLVPTTELGSYVLSRS